MERDESLIISCRACLVFCFLMAKKKKAFKMSIYFQPLITEFFWFSLLWFKIEEKIHNKAVADVSRGGEFWKLFCLAGWETNDSLGVKVCLGRARGWRKLCKLTIKWASSMLVSTDIWMNRRYANESNEAHGNVCFLFNFFPLFLKMTSYTRRFWLTRLGSSKNNLRQD